MEQHSAVVVSTVRRKNILCVWGWRKQGRLGHTPHTHTHALGKCFLLWKVAEQRDGIVSQCWWWCCCCWCYCCWERSERTARKIRSRREKGKEEEEKCDLISIGNSDGGDSALSALEWSTYQNRRIVIVGRISSVAVVGIVTAMVRIERWLRLLLLLLLLFVMMMQLLLGILLEVAVNVVGIAAIDGHGKADGSRMMVQLLLGIKAWRLLLLVLLML